MLVVHLNIERQMVIQPVPLLGRAPGSAKEPIHVRAKHRARMVQGKEWIKTDLLELTLTGYTTTAREHCGVLSEGELLLHGHWVSRTQIRHEAHLRHYDRGNAAQHMA